MCLFEALKLNISVKIKTYLKKIGIKNVDKDLSTSELTWMHILAIGFCPAYLKENADGIRQNWPRIPFPLKPDILIKSADLGNKIANLLNPDEEIKEETMKLIGNDIETFVIPSKIGNRSINVTKGDLEVTWGWGNLGNGGICMPGKGKYEIKKQSKSQCNELLGDEIIDIYI